MRLQLDATPEELQEKGTALISKLARSIAPVDPELADLLEKALPAKEGAELDHPVTRGISKQLRKAYQRHTDSMLKDVVGVLERSKKASSGVVK